MRVYPYISKLKQNGVNIIKYKEIDNFGETIGKSCSTVYRCTINNRNNYCAKEFVSYNYYSISDMFHLLDFELNTSYLVKDSEYASNIYGITYRQINKILYLYIIYEYIENSCTLYSYLNNISNWKYEGKLEFTLSKHIKKHLILELIKGIQYFHNKNIIHCDLKTENIIVTKNENIKIIDYGSSCIMDYNNHYYDNSDYEVPGTIGYMAPELYENDIYYECDIYSLGVCITEILYGELWHNGHDTYGICKDRILNIINELEDNNIKNILFNCVDVNYKNRPTLNELYKVFTNF